MQALRNWTGTVHYSTDGRTPACGRLSTHSSWLVPTDAPATCERCLARYGIVAVAPLPPPPPPGPAELRAIERAARQALRRAAL